VFQLSTERGKLKFRIWRAASGSNWAGIVRVDYLPTLAMAWIRSGKKRAGIMGDLGVDRPAAKGSNGKKAKGEETYVNRAACFPSLSRWHELDESVALSLAVATHHFLDTVD